MIVAVVPLVAPGDGILIGAVELEVSAQRVVGLYPGID
jgi:hypothetical protein